MHFRPAMVSIALLVGAVVLSAPADVASLDCARPSLPSEMAICNSADLGELDEHMTQTYVNLTTDGPGWAARQIQSEQSFWLAQRNLCGYDKDCIANSYQRRFGRLDYWQVRLGF